MKKMNRIIEAFTTKYFDMTVVDGLIVGVTIMAIYYLITLVFYKRKR